MKETSHRRRSAPAAGSAEVASTGGAQGDLLGFRDAGDVRVRVLNDKPERRDGAYVLYWCQIYRRGEDNAALAYAIERANALRLPCVVYEAVRPDYPYASDRFHTFLLECARDVAATLEKRGVGYAFFLPKTKEEARGVVKKLASRAALVVSDDFPSFTIPAQNAAGAARSECAFVVVDDAAGVPMALFPKEEFAARTLRPKLHKVKSSWLRPLAEPEPRVGPPKLDLPFDPVDFSRSAIPELVARCAIDHSVPAVAEFPGGSVAAEARLERFLRSKLSAYTTERNEPSRDATSHLSPYLHFGAISARRVALAAEAWAEDRPGDEAAPAFLEQLLVRRGLAFNFAARNPAHRTFDALPAWAKATLEEHTRDKRPYVTSLADLEDARTPDELWNAAQLELRARGVIHNYARMLWGKLVIPWFQKPHEAHEVLVHLNDKYALDGRDPDGYASVSWCFGLHDRPWPTRPCFGKVRSMTSASARAKLEWDGYLAQARAFRREL